jgi:hypothetical protein
MLVKRAAFSFAVQEDDMPTYYEYQVDETTTILIAGSEEEANGGLMPVARGGREEVIIKAAKPGLREAIQGAKESANVLLEEINELQVSEAEIKFGLTTTGEMGFFAVVKAGMGVNYEMTLKWKRPAPGME